MDSHWSDPANAAFTPININPHGKGSVVGKPASTDTDDRSRTIRWRKIPLGPLAIVCSGIAMCKISWLKWPDLIIDFGRQAYIPWRLSEGDILYRDIWYIYGPISSYLHAFLFYIFEPQLIVIFIFNIAITCLLAFVIYRLFHFIGTPLSATVCTLAFIILFAFAQNIMIGSHNFISSYIYDLTHGIILSFLAVHQFMKFARTRDIKIFMGIGVLSGLILLSKFEVAVAWRTS